MAVIYFHYNASSHMRTKQQNDCMENYEQLNTQSVRITRVSHISI